MHQKKFSLAHRTENLCTHTMRLCSLHRRISLYRRVIAFRSVSKFTAHIQCLLNRDKAYMRERKCQPSPLSHIKYTVENANANANEREQKSNQLLFEYMSVCVCVYV